MVVESHWDNVVQRLMYWHVVVTDSHLTGHCEAFTVSAYTAFGLKVDEALVDCHGSVDG